MKTEKHIIKNRYSTHGIHRNIPVYEMNTIHCSASPMEGYKGTEVTLIDNAAWNEKFSAWALTGATATGNNIILNNDVTAQGIYETAKNLTLQTDGHGQIAANKMSGFIGDQVTLSNTPGPDYIFSAYTITGANLTGNKFNFIGNNVTAKAWFEPTHINYALGEGLYVVDYDDAWNSFDHPTWINGIINFGNSGVAAAGDRFVALKYDLKLGSVNVAGSRAYNLCTRIGLQSNYSAHTFIINDVGTASEQVNHPGVFTDVTTNYLGVVASAGVGRKTMDLYTTLYSATFNQNILQFTGAQTTGYNGWAVEGTGCRWNQRNPVTHKLIIDKQSNRISGFAGGTCRIVVSAKQSPVTGFSAINSIRIDNYENSYGGINNVKLASFSNMSDAFNW